LLEISEQTNFAEKLAWKVHFEVRLLDDRAITPKFGSRNALTSQLSGRDASREIDAIAMTRESLGKNLSIRV
jgi:hypothetical protein